MILMRNVTEGISIRCDDSVNFTWLVEVNDTSGVQVWIELGSIYSVDTINKLYRAFDKEMGMQCMATFKTSLDKQKRVCKDNNIKRAKDEHEKLVVKINEMNFELARMRKESRFRYSLFMLGDLTKFVGDIDYLFTEYVYSEDSSSTQHKLELFNSNLIISKDTATAILPHSPERKDLSVFYFHDMVASDLINNTTSKYNNVYEWAIDVINKLW